MSAIMGVLFDMHKTLVTVAPRPKPSALGRRLGIDEDRYDQADAILAQDFELGLSETDRMRGLLQILNLKDWNHRIDKLVELERTETIARASCYDGVPAVLSETRRRGFRVGLCVNGNPYSEAIARELGLLVPVHGAAFSFQCGHRKPNEVIYLAALRSMGNVQPAQTLYVGDGGDDELAGAKKLGMITALVKNLGEKPRSVDADYKIGPVANLLRCLESLLA